MKTTLFARDRIVVVAFQYQEQVHQMLRCPVLNTVVGETNNRARKSRTTLQNKVRLKVLPEQLTLLVNMSVTFKNCITR